MAARRCLIARFGQSRAVITDKLRSYFRPIRDSAPEADHRAHKGLRNRIEGAHRPTRKREKIMGRFKLPRQAKRFLSAHDQINTVIRHRRCRPSASSTATQDRMPSISGPPMCRRWLLEGRLTAHWPPAANNLAIPARQHVAGPAAAGLVRGHRQRRIGVGGLALQYAQALRHFSRLQPAQRNVVDQQQQFHMSAAAAAGVTPIGTSSVITLDAGLVVQIPQAGSTQRDRPMRCEEAVRAALIHADLGIERRRQLPPGGAAAAFQMGKIDTPFGPLVGAGQGRQRLPFVEGAGVREAVPRCSVSDTARRSASTADHRSSAA